MSVLASNKKRILFYESSSGIGGSGNMLGMIVKNINKDLFEPHIAISHIGPQTEKLKKMGFPTIHVPLNKWEKRKTVSKIASSYPVYLLDLLFKMYPAARKMAKYIKAKEIELVHVNTDMTSGMAGIIAAKLANVPCVCHARSTKKKTLRRERIFAKWVDHFVLINKDMFGFYEGFVAKEKLSLVPDGIEMDTFEREVKPVNIRKEFKMANDAPLIGIVGRIVDGKGHDDFIKAAALVSQKNSNARFLIIGDDPDDGQPTLAILKKLVKEQNLENHIIFTGWRNDVASITAELDCMVQATSTFPEGFGLTCIEAMTLNKPVIATNIPGPKDIVVNQETGLLVEPQNPQQMADAIMFMIENPDKAKAMGQKGKQRVEECFDFRKNVKKLEDIYEGGIELLHSEPVLITSRILLKICKFAIDSSRKKKFVLGCIAVGTFIGMYLLTHSLWITDIVMVLLFVGFLFWRHYKSRQRKLTYQSWESELKLFEFNVNNLPDFSYIYLKDLIKNERIREEIEAVLANEQECVIANIDQNGRCLPFYELIANFKNVTKQEFVPRKRYKVEIVVLREYGNIVAIKKNFKNDRTDALDEAYILNRLEICLTPKLIKYDAANNTVYMTFVPGKNVKDELINKGVTIRDVDLKRNPKAITDAQLSEARAILTEMLDVKEVAQQVRRINSYGVIMEDVKCGNIIIEQRSGKPFWIDFHGCKVNRKIKALISLARYSQVVKDLRRIFFLREGDAADV